jgi:hypothetical protein
MAYIPKNKVQTNLYTEGNEYIYASSKIKYTGYYHKLYNGKIFSEGTPNHPNIKELIPYISPNIENRNNNSIDNLIPTSPLFPTPQDYKNGEYIRYFIVKRNEPIFIETTKTEYNKYKSKDPSSYWRLYKHVSLFWRLTGEINQVAQTNKNITELVEQREQVFGLGIYLKENWTQYYQVNS